MVPRKRGRDEMESSEPPKEKTLLETIRNMWEFACVMQYIFTFGKVVKIDEDFDIEDFETECLNPDASHKLEEIGLTLLKWISSHRGLTPDNWDEYARRQYVAKAPQLNPYGTEEIPKAFRSFDIFQRIRVLHQLTVWTFWNPDRLRERMPEQKETDQTLWRIEELGWDREERSYYVLDDSRLYRRTEPPIPVASKVKPKSNTLKAQAARRRASKRRRIETSETPEVKDEDMSVATESNAAEDTSNGHHQLDTFGGYKWECIAVTCQQYQDFVKAIEKSRDPNEKDLYLRIIEQVLPVVEKAEESHRRKMEKRQKELLNIQKLTGAKRSSRLADKHERERREREDVEAADKHAAELAAAHKEQERQAKMEQDRQSRMMTREQRIKDREYKRLLHEEELARVAEEAKRVEAGEARGSERHLKAQMEKHKRDLEDLSTSEDWVFDCSACGVYGKNVDDGAHSVACEKCNVWQHSQCLGIRRIEAEKDDFHFVCKDCKQKLDDARRPNIKLKFRAGLSSSPPQIRESRLAEAISPTMKFRAIEIPAQQQQNARTPSQGRSSNTAMESPQKGTNGIAPSPYLEHAASGTPNGHATHPMSGSVYLNGSPKSHAENPYLLDPSYHQSAASSTYTNGHASSPFRNQSPQLQSSRPTSGHGTNQYPQYEINQPQGISQQRQIPLSSTPQTRLTSNQVAYGVAATPTSQHQGRLPSPVLNRPSMSPTQGNPDVGPVAGVPQRCPTGTSMSPPPSQASMTQNHNGAVHTQYDNQHQTTPYLNEAEPKTQTQDPNVNHHHLSGLSPTKHSPAQPYSLHPPSQTSPNHLPPSATSSSSTTNLARRSISGTPIFPPTEMLQPSPKQLSKSPVPTPSKGMGMGMTPSSADIGAGELKRVSKEIRVRVEGG